MTEQWTKPDDDRYEKLRSKWRKELATPGELAELRSLVQRGQRIGLFTVSGNGQNAELYAVKSKILNFPVTR